MGEINDNRKIEQYLNDYSFYDGFLWFLVFLEEFEEKINKYMRKITIVFIAIFLSFMVLSLSGKSVNASCGLPGNSDNEDCPDGYRCSSHQCVAIRGGNATPIPPVPTATPTPPPGLPGDANGDGVADFLDYFYYVSARYGGGVPLTVKVDFNKDGAVDDKDRQILIPSLLKVLGL